MDRSPSPGEIASHLPHTVVITKSHTGTAEPFIATTYHHWPLFDYLLTYGLDLNMILFLIFSTNLFCNLSKEKTCLAI